MTPHIKAKKGEIAKVVIMPGDPLRAKFVAENFLENAKLVSDVRNMFCYTGTYKGKEVSVMGHGMGIPSIGIYSYELFHFYDVQKIVRIGSAGSYYEDIKVGDVFLANEAFSESNYARLLGLEDATDVLKAPNEDINNTIIEKAKELNIDLKIGRCYSSDVFYGKEGYQESRERTKSQVVEMEAYALFANAIKLNKEAAVLLTCSDSLVTDEALSPELRQTSFKDMINLVLESIIL